MDVLLSVLGLLGVVAVTFGTAIFVAAEFSLTTLERSQVDQHVAEVGDRRARSVQRAHRNLSFQLSGAQLGITITTLITGYLAQPAIATLISPVLEDVGMPAGPAAGAAAVPALVLATALSMVFGELVPKNLAIARPLRHGAHGGGPAGDVLRAFVVHLRAQRVGELDRAASRGRAGGGAALGALAPGARLPGPRQRRAGHPRRGHRRGDGPLAARSASGAPTS